jgi:hypothetical protein
MMPNYDPPEDREPSKTFACLAAIAIASIAIAIALPAAAETQTRDVGSFDTIVLKGGAKLKIAIADKTSVEVEGDSDALDDTKTEVRDGRLTIDVVSDGWSPFHHSTDGPTITVTVPHLAALDLSGGADVGIDGLAGGATKLVIAGAGHVEAHGRLDSAEIVVNGAADVDYADVSADDARTVVNGVGHVRIQARHSLAAIVNGVGAVEYSGNPPKVDSAIHGVGSIEPVNEAAASR